ncbi:C-C motif chemokine 25 [Neoarius graeffei]|uniref:C-C motif chemokine 25 n=1 Tax=Neoarius graeffei TaxID=443677 RepID=UPI00298D090E|nr:C-C motif chemokine 25 [Neoarius graeffei]
MRFSLLFFLVFLSVLYLSLAQGLYEDCCLSYVKEVKVATKRRVVSYRRQEQDGGCNLSAVVFKLKRGQLFCARPGDKWVQDLVKHIDKKIQKWKSISAKRRYKQAK